MSTTTRESYAEIIRRFAEEAVNGVYKDLICFDQSTYENLSVPDDIEIMDRNGKIWSGILVHVMKVKGNRIACLKLEEKHKSGGNGHFGNIQYFVCEPGYSLCVPLECCRPCKGFSQQNVPVDRNVETGDITRIATVDFEERVQCKMIPIDADIVGFQCIWTINNFPGLNKIVPNKKCIQMKEVLNISFGKKCHWTMWLYPNGICDETKNQIGIFLMFKKANSDLEDVWASYQFKVFDKLGKVAFSKEPLLYSFNVETKSGIAGYGQHNFMDVDFPEKNNLLLDRSLSIIVQGAVWTRKPSGEKDDLNSLLKSSLRSLTSSLKILKSGKHSDIIFSVGGEQFDLHKVILANGSDVFNDMFEKEKNISQNIIQVDNVEPEVFRELVHFIYTKNVTGKFEKFADKLLVAADLYKIDELKTLCEKKLIQSIVDVDNVAECYLLAYKCSAESLKTATCKFIRENSKAIKLTEGWNTLLMDKDAAVSLLQITLE